MAESAQIATMTPRHENIIAYLIANPTMKKGEVARTFGVTPAWLSTIIHSDIFQAKLRERQDEFFSAATVPIRDKLEALASMSLDRMLETVETERDPTTIREMAKLALDRIGHGPQSPNAPSPGTPQTNVFIGVSPELLAAARERIFQRRGDVINGDTGLLDETDSGAAEAIQAGGDS